MLEIDLEMEIGVRALGLRDFGGYLVNCRPRGSSGRAAGDPVGGGGRGAPTSNMLMLGNGGG